MDLGASQDALDASESVSRSRVVAAQHDGIALASLPGCHDDAFAQYQLALNAGGDILARS